MGEPDADFDALLAEQGELMEVIDHADAWELDSRSSRRWTRCAARRRRRRHGALRW
jgi:hypothetical protein